MKFSDFRMALVNYGWIVVALALIALYIWRPYWPPSVRQLPLWPLLSLFVLVVVFATLFVAIRLTVFSVAGGVAVLALGLYLEHFGYAIFFEVSRGHVDSLIPDLATYLVIPIFNVVVNFPVLMAFVMLETLIIVFYRNTSLVESE